MILTSTHLTKDDKGYSLIHQGRVLVNGLSVEDICFIVPDLSPDEINKVGKGSVLAIKEIQHLASLDTLRNSV